MGVWGGVRGVGNRVDTNSSHGLFVGNFLVPEQRRQFCFNMFEES